jgi:hypothetical protein
MSDWRKERCIGGLFSPPPSNFWHCHGKRTLSMWAILIWSCSRCGTGAILVAAFARGDGILIGRPSLTGTYHGRNGVSEDEDMEDVVDR